MGGMIGVIRRLDSFYSLSMDFAVAVVADKIHSASILIFSF
jgi:hypothetical protein